MTNTNNSLIFDSKKVCKDQKNILCFCFNTKHVKHHQESNSKYYNVWEIRAHQEDVRIKIKTQSCVTSSYNYRHVFACDTRYSQHVIHSVSLKLGEKEDIKWKLSWKFPNRMTCRWKWKFFSKKKMELKIEHRTKRRKIFFETIGKLSHPTYRQNCFNFCIVMTLKAVLSSRWWMTHDSWSVINFAWRVNFVIQNK